jgi:hypothetical protein
MHIEAHCGVCLDLNYLLAYIALAFIAGCHLFSCLFYSCKFGFDNKQFNRYIIFFFGLWFSILLNFFVVESVLCPKTLFSTDVSLILEFSFQHISIFLILDCSRTVNLLLEKKKTLNWANVCSVLCLCLASMFWKTIFFVLRQLKYRISVVPKKKVCFVKFCDKMVRCI